VSAPVKYYLIFGATKRQLKIPLVASFLDEILIGDTLKIYLVIRDI
jgi:hypothetical protein